MSALPLTYVFLIPVAFAFLAFGMAARRAAAIPRGEEGKLHSLPKYHGYLVALSVLVPSLLLILAWLMLEPLVLWRIVVADLPDLIRDAGSSAQLSLIVSQVQQAATGTTFGTPEPYIVEGARTLVAAQQWSRWLLPVVVVSICLLAIFLILPRISLRFRARDKTERVIRGILIVCAIVSILATVGILASLVFEGYRFFSLVPLTEFLFGTRWDTQIAIRPDQVASSGAFGAIPVFAGTLMIALIAMAVATPVGLFAAIYMAEFASPLMRGVVKPLIEVLAGIPTIVYGFFAVLVVSPAIREWGGAIGLSISPTAAIVPGLVMGVMLIPFISSLADDAINAVPTSLRDGSLGLGADRNETVTKVILPAALPGIVGGILLATSRAIGETMIVVMAAGLTANLTANPFEGVTTVTVQIVTLLIGDTAFDNPKTLAAFGLGLSLFVATLGLNLLALGIVRKYREQYD
ncbi:phosphate ABC transporter permease subunit PstC [Aurantimonas aggregata]|uniref:Phosphate transport system permease protein n=1 Tax=Aurantimonas aggregata TaxID=2047720 RepID=A0A6L9MH36_9HYPH|nr:phosphate ABC transporter permease subunit PstC [Aurantimonas aggregata]